MMHDVTMVFSETRGTWNVIADGEWYFEGNYDQCCKIMDSFYQDEDEQYEQDDREGGYWDDLNDEYGEQQEA